jgi:DnaJ-class molecular chaperone
MFAIIRALRIHCFNCVGSGTINGATCRRCGGSGIEPGT